MAVDFDTFYARIRRIARERSKLTRGYTLFINDNNLIMPRPHYVATGFPWRAVFVALLIFLTFKAYIIAVTDGPTYAMKLNALERGHPLEQVGAWVMQRDPATTAVAQVMRMIER